MGREAGEDQERGHRNHLQLLGWIRPQEAGENEEGQLHSAVPPEMPGAVETGIQRTEDCLGGSSDVHQGGSDNRTPLHFLRLHRHQGECTSLKIFTQ